MTIDIPSTPDLGAIKTRQQATWASGDYHVIGARIVLSSELLLESLDVRSTERVLDVATGSGNAALAAARRGCDVVGVDYVPSLLERARMRAAAEGLPAVFQDGDAEALPFADASFDVTTSVFGAMFAPDHAATAAELARVTRPGGRIGLVSHTPEGFIGQLFKTIGRHVPPPAGVASPVLWGTSEHLETLFGDDLAELRTERRQLVFRYPSAEAYLDEWRRWYGPTQKAFEVVGAAGEAALAADILDLVARFDRAADGSMVVASDYLEAVIVRR
jgi:ubiquinone/menaquinone biosynthesis C-methylase UbiE